MPTVRDNIILLFKFDNDLFVKNAIQEKNHVPLFLYLTIHLLIKYSLIWNTQLECTDHCLFRAMLVLKNNNCVEVIWCYLILKIIYNVCVTLYSS